MTAKDHAYLESVYYDPRHPASFGGPAKLYLAAKKDGRKIGLDTIEKWLKGEETYTLHRPSRKKFPRNKVYVPRIDHQWDADLMDMTRVAKYNDGYNYVLLVIDIFSRYVWTVPLKSKKADEVIRAFSTVFEERKPKYLRTDKGGEFIGAKTGRFFESNGVRHFVTQNEEIKANYAERAIKTIKMKIYKYFTHKQTYAYADRLSDFTRSYNLSYHRTIKRAPAEVNEDNEKETHDTQYLGINAKPKPYAYKVGDYVRISRRKKTFSREYEEKWTGEIFEISERFKRDNLSVYKIKDYNKEEITGRFYEQELQGVVPRDVFKVEKVLKTRKRKGRPKEYLVRWLRWPPKYDSWVTELETL